MTPEQKALANSLFSQNGDKDLIVIDHDTDERFLTVEDAEAFLQEFYSSRKVVVGLDYTGTLAIVVESHF